MKIFLEQIGAKIIIKISGEIDSFNYSELERKMLEAFDQCGEIIIDFQDLNYIGSAGIAVLIRAYNVAETKNVR